MSSELYLGLAASVFGGSIVSVITHLGNRGRIKAETAKLMAETERTKAETLALLGSAGLHSGETAAPPGWKVAGSRPDDYRITLDRTVAHSGSSSARLEAQPGARGFVTLMQTVRAKRMRGRRIRMSAFMKLEDVEHAALWMRVDEPEGTTSRFDNMDDRKVTGTRDWAERQIVLDVPTAAETVNFGAILAGRGRLWVDDFSLDPVSPDVPTTDMLQGNLLHPEPWNLGFEE